LGLAARALAAGVGSDPAAFAALAAFTLLLALATLGMGFVISVMTRRGSTAVGAALLLWLGLAFFGDLGVLGATLAVRPAPSAALAMLLINPLQAFKLGAIFSLHSTLDTLGAAGQYAAYRFGAGLPWMLAGLLVLWSALAFGLAFAIFNRRGDV
jgi:Cu-processing system permease protein